MVEGSIRKSTDRIRITVQLIETATGNQLWGKRYDAEIKNLFELEEDLSRTIAATVTGQIDSDLQRIAIAKGAANQDSYDLLLGGIYHCYKFTQSDTIIAIKKLNQCLENEPGNVRAHTTLFICHLLNYLERWVVDPHASFERADVHISKSLSLDPNIGTVQSFYGEYLIFCKQPGKALGHINKALQINPNDPDAITMKAFALEMMGEFEQALELAELGHRLDPYIPWADWNLAECQIFSGQYEKALETISNSKNDPELLKMYYIVANIKLNRKEPARRALKEFMQECRNSMATMPTTLAEWLQYSMSYTPFEDASLNEDIIDCLVQAGLEDELDARQQLNEPDDLPSIAVLPFENMSGDPEQEFFSDGITTDIISTLSRFRHMRVVSRYSTIQYKNQKASISEIADQQSVRYILEGSVRKSGDHIRVNANLIDSSNEEICWRERYDRDLDDIFAVQDEITKNITVAMKVHFEDGDKALQLVSGTANIKAWELVLTAVDLQDTYIQQNILDARTMIKQALKLDPDYVNAWVMLGWTHWQEAYSGWCNSFQNAMHHAENAVKKAFDLDPENAEAWALKGTIHLMNHEPEASLNCCRKAVELAPGNTEMQALMAFTFCFIGNFEEATEYYETTLKLCPVPPNWYSLIGAHIKQHSGDPGGAIEILQQAIAVEPDSPLCRFYLMDAMLEKADETGARRLAEEIRALDKSVTGKGLVRCYSQDKSRRDRFQSNLAKMGFSD